MKPVFKIIPAIALLFATAESFGQVDHRIGQDDKKGRKRYENFKERNISKSYPASGNNLTIENQFGDVKITTWDKNEIKVDIHIEASSDNKERAENTFNKIDVKDKQEGKDINFTTTFSHDKEGHCDNCSSTMIIDYDIHMPATNKLTLRNSFGDIDIPDYSGPLSISSNYGGLTAGKMAKLDKLEINFGHATLKSLSNCDVTFSYSSITIDNLSGNNKMKMEFCSYSKISLDNDLSSLTLHDSYSVVHLRPAANFSASYDISTSYGSFTDKTGAGIKRTDTPQQYGPDLDKHYEGKSGSGAAKIVINSSFGSILIGEGSKEDMKGKRETKTKTTRV